MIFETYTEQQAFETNMFKYFVLSFVVIYFIILIVGLFSKEVKFDLKFIFDSLGWLVGLYFVLAFFVLMLFSIILGVFDV